jgi:hypothetical protein
MVGKGFQTDFRAGMSAATNTWAALVVHLGPWVGVEHRGRKKEKERLTTSSADGADKPADVVSL